MNTTSNKYITVAYELYTDFDGKQELVEKAPVEHPFQFISGLGTTLDAFEAQITPLAKGDKFDFVLSIEEAYGEYEQEHVVEVPKEVFHVNGKFDNEHIYPGAVSFSAGMLTAVREKSRFVPRFFPEKPALDGWMFLV